MKSLVEEASTIVKALEKAWTRAGKPQTFSVKIFEEEETNFFGFTKKSAKVGIFFEEKQVAGERKNFSRNQQRNPQRRNSNQSAGQRPRPFNKNRDNRQDNRNNQEANSSQTKTDSPRPQSQHNNDRQDFRQKPVEQKPVEQKSTERKTVERKTVERKPAERRPVEKSRDTKPAQAPTQTEAPKTTTAPRPTTPAPLQRKVLKVSGRRYSSQKKKDD